MPSGGILRIMPSPLYFDVYVDDFKLGTFGHPQVLNLHIALSGSNDLNMVFASAVCSEGEVKFYYSWAEETIGSNSEVRIVPVAKGPVAAPIRRYEIGRFARNTLETNECHFCHRTETEVPRLLEGDDNRPGICSDCVEI